MQSTPVFVISSDHLQEGHNNDLWQSHLAYKRTSVVKKAFSNTHKDTLHVKDMVMSIGENINTSIGFSFIINDVKTVDFVLADSEGHLIERYDLISVGAIEDDENAYRYKVVFNDLIPSHGYQFRLETEDENSEIKTFILPDTSSLDLLIFGDLQGYKQSQYERFTEVFSYANDLAGGVDGLVLVGDLVDRGDNESQWDYFHYALDTLNLNIPLMTAIGNHDVYGTTSGYMQAFNFPVNGVEGLDQRNYYVDVPFGRIAVWDTESYSRYEEQEMWLKEIMSDETIVHKIVVMHRSVYPMMYDEGHVRALAKVFDEAGIDLVISGHDHIYNRTTMKDGQKVPLGEGVTYVVCGSGSGSKFYEKEGQRSWEEIIYDDNNPIAIHLVLEDSDIKLKSYGIVGDLYQIVDEFVIEK